MKKLSLLLALVAFGLYANTSTSMASAPVLNQSQVEFASEVPGGNMFDDTVGHQWNVV